MNDHKFVHSAVIALTALAFSAGPSGVIPHAQAQSATVSNVMTPSLAARDALPTSDGSLWRFEGPRNLHEGGHSLGLGPYSGRINELAIDPSNPFIMYATGATGGVWKTGDGGTHWAARSASWRVQAATAVAVDPNNVNRIFAGTGDYKRLDHLEPFSVGVMRSLDGGLTWQQFGNVEMRDFTVSRIVVDPLNSNDVLAATGRGGRLPGGQIFRSTTAGSTWTGVGPADANWDDLRLCDGHLFWAAGTRKHDLDSDSGGAGGFVWTSPDGVTWTKINLNTNSATLGAFHLDTISPFPDVIKIACGNTAIGNVVFVAVFLSGSARVFGTLDRGLTWFEVTAAPVAGVMAGPWAHSAFAVTRNRLYVGGVFPQMASLSSLVPVGSLLLGTLTFAGIPSITSDTQCFVPDPTEADAVFVCNDKGVYRFSATLNTLRSLNATLGVTQVYRMDVHPRHGGLIAAGAQDLGDFASFFGQGGNATAIQGPANWAMVIGCDGRSAAFRGDSSSEVYLSNTCGEVARYDGAATSIDLHDGPNGQAPLVFSGALDVLNYADTTFFRFSNPGSAFALIATFPLPAPQHTIQSLARCSTDSNIVYAASGLGEFSYSSNGGQTWTPSAQTGLPLAPIWAIAPSPGNCHDVLVGVGYEGGGVGELRNGTNLFNAGPRLFHTHDVTLPGTWSGAHGSAPVLPFAPIFGIVRHPSAPDTRWFVSGDVGVFRTDDAGVHWTNATAPLGLPNTLVRDLRLSADGNTLYAGTFGRGIWSMDVNRPASNLFGVRGLVTQASQPIVGQIVSASGPGRIRQWLKNTLTAGRTAVTTAPIDVAASATISAASASLNATFADAVSLLTPTGATLPMTGTTILGSLKNFQLTPASASALVGQGTKGKWAFVVTGGILTPSVTTGLVDLQFTGSVSAATGSDGEYTIEYLAQGSHFVSTLVNSVQQLRSINLVSNQLNVNFAVAPVGVSLMEPKFERVDVHDVMTYTLTYTITDGRSWRDVAIVQVRFSDDQGEILWVQFDTAERTFRVVDPDTGALGHAFGAGSPNLLESSAATLYLAGTVVAPNVPDPSSVTLTIPVSFKPRADRRILDIQVIAQEQSGNRQGPDLVGKVQVGDVPAPPPAPIEENE